MNVIVYWKTGGYADVYNVDKVVTPSKTEQDLRLYRKHKGQDFEVARFDGQEFSGWQIFLTVDDVKP